MGQQPRRRSTAALLGATKDSRRSRSRSPAYQPPAPPISPVQTAPLLLPSLYVGYLLSVASSSSIELAIPMLYADTSVDISAEDVARGLAAGQVATVVGKLIAGFVVDTRGAAAYAEVLLSVGVCMLVGTAALSSSWRHAALASFLLYKVCKACAWPAMAKAAKVGFPASDLASAWSVLVTSSRVGAVLGGATLGPVAAAAGWACPILTVAAGLLVAPWLAAAQLRRVTIGRPCASAQTAGRHGIVTALSTVLSQPQLCLIFGSEAMLLAVMDASSLFPLYLTTPTHTGGAIDIATAARLAAAFPLGIVVSLCTGEHMMTWLSRQLTHGRIIFFCASGLIASCAFAALALWIDITPSQIALLLFVVGFGIYLSIRSSDLRT